MLNNTTPIIAIATASGNGGIGIVRISGKNLDIILKTICNTDLVLLKPRYATFLSFRQADATIIDSGLVIYFQAPYSYTGEDVLEFQIHGGMIVMQMLLARCLEVGVQLGLRLAAPGEFTQRAFLNKKIDLTQAEAISDLIEASTEAAAKSASLSLSGVFSDIIYKLVNKITNLRMLVEGALNFSEDEVSVSQTSNISIEFDSVCTTVEQVLLQASQSMLCKKGLRVVLVGKPNVGKSSLLNVLAGEDVAIVTAIAGTTRDKITASIQIKGIPFNIIDTAGIRDISNKEVSLNEVECIGIQRTWLEIAQADIILYILDVKYGMSLEDEAILKYLPDKIPVIYIWNKIDLTGTQSKVNVLSGKFHIYLSTINKQGMDLLYLKLLSVIEQQQTLEFCYLARERHVIALKSVRDCLQRAKKYVSIIRDFNDESFLIFAEELRLAQEMLGNITGKFTSDDLLGVIFSKFCIGK